MESEGKVMTNVLKLKQPGRTAPWRGTTGCVVRNTYKEFDRRVVRMKVKAVTVNVVPYRRGKRVDSGGRDEDIIQAIGVHGIGKYGCGRVGMTPDVHELKL